jgi:hypothetical protein
MAVSKLCGSYGLALGPYALQSGCYSAKRASRRMGSGGGRKSDDIQPPIYGPQVGQRKGPQSDTVIVTYEGQGTVNGEPRTFRLEQTVSVSPDGKSLGSVLDYGSWTLKK